MAPEICSKSCLDRTGVSGSQSGNGLPPLVVLTCFGLYNFYVLLHLTKARTHACNHRVFNYIPILSTSFGSKLKAFLNIAVSINLIFWLLTQWQKHEAVHNLSSRDLNIASYGDMNPNVCCFHYFPVANSCCKHILSSSDTWVDLFGKG